MKRARQSTPSSSKNKKQQPQVKRPKKAQKISAFTAIPSHIQCSCLLPFLPAFDLILNVQLVNKQLQKYVQSKELWQKINEPIFWYGNQMEHIVKNRVFDKYPATSIVLSNDVSQSMAQQFLDLMKTQVGSRLKSLGFIGIEILDTHLFEMINTLTQLKVLQLENVEIKPGAPPVSISNKRRSELTKLKIEQVFYSDDRWIRTLIQSAPNLSVFLLEGVDITENPALISATPSLLAMIFGQCKSLKDLVIVGGGSVDDASFLPLVNSEARLEHISVRFCSLSYRFIEILAASTSASTLKNICTRDLDDEESILPARHQFKNIKKFSQLSNLKVPATIFNELYNRKWIANIPNLSKLSVKGSDINFDAATATINSLSFLKTITLEYESIVQMLNVLSQADCANTLTAISLIGDVDFVAESKGIQSGRVLPNCTVVAIRSVHMDSLQMISEVLSMFPACKSYCFDNIERKHLTDKERAADDKIAKSWAQQFCSDKITELYVLSCIPEMSEAMLHFALSLPQLTCLHLSDVWGTWILDSDTCTALAKHGTRPNIKEVFLSSVCISVQDWIAFLLLLPNIEIFTTLSCAVLDETCLGSIIGDDFENIPAGMLLSVAKNVFAKMKTDKLTRKYLKNNVLTEEGRIRIQKSTNLTGYDLTFAQLYKCFKSGADLMLQQELEEAFYGFNGQDPLMLFGNDREEYDSENSDGE